MNNLQLQEQRFESIKSLCSSFKKDPISRKTAKYLNLRLTSLEDQWNDFSSRHIAIEQELEDKTIKYFTDDVYNLTKNLYETTKSAMKTLLQKQLDQTKNVKFDLTGMFDDSTNEKLEALITKQECNFKAIDRVMSKVHVDVLTEKWELEDQLSILKSKWDHVDKLHWELEAHLKGTNDNYNELFAEIEDKYDDLRKKLSNKIWTSVHYEKTVPKVEIPEFSGNYTQWISFKDLFLETVHNNPLINNAQKMQLLKSKLKGEAERLVKHLTINSDNYNSCWEILVQRYNNRRLQFTSSLNTIMDLPIIQEPDAINLKKMHDVIQEALNALSNMGIDTNASGSIIAHLMSMKLDSKSFDEYIKDTHESREVPTISELLYFLENKFMAYEVRKSAKRGSNNDRRPSTYNHQKPFVAKKPNFEIQKPFSKNYHTVFAQYGQCPCCDNNHVLMQCPKFLQMNTIQRNNVVAKLKVCKNCLFSHGNAKCTSNKTCKECNMNHHTLLHNSTKSMPPSNNGNTSGRSQSSNHLASDEIEVLLTTVQLNIKTIDGTYVTLRALLDQGSQVNLITENAAQLLRLPRKKINATINGIGSVSGDCKGRLQISCKSMYSNYTFETEALILRKLTNNLPNSTFDKQYWPHIENLKLADPEYNISRSVDLLLGADIYSEIIMDGVLKGEQQSPIAQQTRLGWILCGRLKTFNCHVTLVDINEISKFWEFEDITNNDDNRSKDDECEIFYEKNVKREPNGSYTVKMPFCPDFEKKLGTSKSIAISQFLQLEKRLQRKHNLAARYKDFIREYIELGHMKPATPISNSAVECYLPHHGVLREQSTTTKLRVVFNASQKTSSGYSLNSLQEKGCNLQKDIQSLILKWRSYQYAFTADIEKMYRCIWISEDQQPLQKIIWRNSPTERLQELQLCTVTYGTKSAPWLAIRTLQQLANDDREKYPTAANVLLNEFFVDDLVSGHNSLNEAQELQQSLIDLLGGANMNLRKWSSNHPALLQNLKEDQISTQTTYDFKHEQTTKMLGLGWNPEVDNFIFNWELEEKCKLLTKRHLLSEISKLYDPLGWLSPITVSAKLIFQKVWTNKLEWNDILPIDIQKEWLNIRSELPVIKNVSLKRWIGGTQNIELLGFCDASEKAYACVVYSRVKGEQDKPIITLLAAKTRVAPLSQKTTLPRLELNGALLLSQLIGKTKKALSSSNVTVQAWCDSQVVLAWIQGASSRWERYVANRVDKIKSVISAEQWHYVKSENNPADCASRGLLPSKLINYNLWWNGPNFLKTTTEQLPQNMTKQFTTNLCQAKPAKSENVSTSTKNINFINELLHKHSSLNHITRVTAWVTSFATTALNKVKRDTNYLTALELEGANEQIIKYVQQVEFETEYKQLAKKEIVSAKSKIYKLNPYLDEKGIIRVGGRLNNSLLPSGMKNPIILSSNGRLTQLIIQRAHMETLHGGARLTLAHIRQRFWIISGNRAVKTYLRHCVRCHRFKPTNAHQLMGNLPPQRTTPSRPFTHTGVDFTGHVDVKMNKGRGVKTTKGYVAIFVCMATKAVHIELVSDLSTDAFLAAFKRMSARRGIPKHVYSDCGTNFIGASRKLRHEFEEFKQQLSAEFFTEIAKMAVEWHFNAPAWPSAGGLWEAAVKSMKHHLRRVLGDQKLTFEEFATLLTQIEACLNSRPLCPLTENPDEFYNCLTPGHFLTGSPTMSLPLSDYSDVRTIDLRKRWQLTEHMYQQFWKSWSNEYLSQLQSRGKWNIPTTNVKECDVVLVREEKLSPGKWALGRVLELHPGTDGYVRVTTIKTKTGTMKRPLVKLSPLPKLTEIESEEKDHPKTKCELHKKDKKNNASISKINKTILCLFAFFTLLTGGHSNDVSSRAHITTFEPHRPVYYDTLGKIKMIHDEWTLLMYYNLTNYWDGVERVSTYLDQLGSLCQMTDPRYCNVTINQLRHEMDTLNHYNNLLLAPQKHLGSRKRRGLINGIGSLANDLFGILDQHFADKYQQDIQSIQNNELHLLELIKNQTTIVELENKILKRNEDNIKQQVTMINNFMKQTNENLDKVESELEVVMATSYFSSASLTTYLLINNLKKLQEMLFNTLTNIYKGHIDIQLISPVNLVNELNVIAGRLPKTLSLPVDNAKENVKDIYKLLYIKARVTSNYFLFEVHIPLISNEDFILHRVLPIPVKNQQETTVMEVTSKYIAVNLKENTYTLLTEEDMRQCTQQRANIFICSKNLPVFNLHNDNAPCEARLLGHYSTARCTMNKVTCKDAWIELHSSNSWLVICCDTCTLRTFCDDDVTSHVMTSSGIITLEQGCVLQSKELTIHSHNIYNSDMKLDFHFDLPSINSSINKIVNLTYHRLTPSPLPTHSEVEEVDKRLASQREHESTPLLSTISSHDIHQYSVLYSVVGIIIAIAIVWTVKRRCATHQVTTTTAAVSRSENIELQSIRGGPPHPLREEPHYATCRQQPPPHHQKRKINSAIDNITFKLDNIN